MTYEKNKQKAEYLANTVFNVLATGLHEQDTFTNKFIIRSIANSLYDASTAPRFYSGLISEEAREKILTGQMKRSELCKEHPYPRTRTTLDLMNAFTTKFRKASNNTIKSDMADIIERGCKVHHVLTKENQKLYPFQQDYSLSEEEIYSKAGVVLVPDIKVDIIPFIYTFNEIDYKMSVDKLSEEIGFSKYKTAKMIKSGEIQKRENK